LVGLGRGRGLGLGAQRGGVHAQCWGRRGGRALCARHSQSVSQSVSDGEGEGGDSNQQRRVSDVLERQMNERTTTATIMYLQTVFHCFVWTLR